MRQHILVYEISCNFRGQKVRSAVPLPLRKLHQVSGNILGTMCLFILFRSMQAEIFRAIEKR